MKVVVFGGSGRIGRRLVRKLQERGAEAVSASPSSGVNTVTGEGVATALRNTQIVVDVTNAPVSINTSVLSFFETSTRNLLAAETTTGAAHHVLLSVVGAERIVDSGYMRAKVAQEALVKNGPIPFTILRATQFFEFLGDIANANTVGEFVRLPAVFVQPAAIDDVAAVLAEVALGEPANGTIDLAGPEVYRLDEVVREFLRALQDPRQVITDNEARYFGAALGERTLLPAGDARIAPTRFEAWLQDRKGTLL